jgi:hypothetical protein
MDEAPLTYQLLDRLAGKNTIQNVRDSAEIIRHGEKVGGTSVLIITRKLQDNCMRALSFFLFIHHLALPVIMLATELLDESIRCIVTII